MYVCTVEREVLMTVCISRALEEQFPAVADPIKYYLKRNNIQLKVLNSSNLWCRDLMPVRTGSGYTKFVYETDDRFPQLEVGREEWAWVNPRMSDIKLDGGNVVQNDQHVFMTEMVFLRNRRIPRPSLVQFLKDIFQKDVLFLPVEPGDDLGHSDGIIKCVDDSTVLINDYSSITSQTYFEYSRQLERILIQAGYKISKMPWAYPKAPYLSEMQFRKQYPYADNFNPGYGYFLNFYKVGLIVFLPMFTIPEDYDAIAVIEQNFPGHEIVPVECSDISMLGGLCNCVTWEFIS